MPLRSAAARCAVLLPMLALAACVARVNTVCRAEIPLEDREHLIVAHVLVNGTPVAAILDTGAQTSAIANPLVTRLALPPDPQHGTQMFGVGGEGTPEHDVLVDRLDLAGFDPAIGHYPVITVPLHEDNADPVGVLIGADVLSHFDIFFDIGNNRAVLYDPDRCAMPLPDVPGPFVQVPLDVLWSGRLRLSVTLDGHEMRALLDSGATATVLDQPAAERLGVSAKDLARELGGKGEGAAGSPFQHSLHRFRTMQIAGERFDNPSVSVIDRSLREADMLLGLDWLRTRRVWISYRRHMLFIAQPIG